MCVASWGLMMGILWISVVKVGQSRRIRAEWNTNHQGYDRRYSKQDSVVWLFGYLVGSLFSYLVV